MVDGWADKSKFQKSLVKALKKSDLKVEMVEGDEEDMNQLMVSKKGLKQSPTASQKEEQLRGNIKDTLNFK